MYMYIPLSTHIHLPELADHSLVPLAQRHVLSDVSIRQHTSAYASIRQHTSAHVRTHI
jgi:hypothetical protein